MLAKVVDLLKFMLYLKNLFEKENNDQFLTHNFIIFGGLSLYSFIFIFIIVFYTKYWHIIRKACADLIHLDFFIFV